MVKEKELITDLVIMLIILSIAFLAQGFYLINHNHDNFAFNILRLMFVTTIISLLGTNLYYRRKNEQ